MTNTSVGSCEVAVAVDRVSVSGVQRIDF